MHLKIRHIKPRPYLLGINELNMVGRIMSIYIIGILGKNHGENS